jgi:hypothetical protein
MYLKLFTIGFIIFIEIIIIENITKLIREHYKITKNKPSYYLSQFVELYSILVITYLSLNAYLRNNFKTFRISYIILLLQLIIVVYWSIKNLPFIKKFIECE